MTLGIAPALLPFQHPTSPPHVSTVDLSSLHTHPQVVRTRAADNLGELTRMSARLEQLVQDLATSGRTAEPQVGREGQAREPC